MWALAAAARMAPDHIELLTKLLWWKVGELNVLLQKHPISVAFKYYSICGGDAPMSFRLDGLRALAAPKSDGRQDT